MSETRDRDQDRVDPSHPPAPELLEGLDSLPVAEHVGRFDAVHDQLRARLDHDEDEGAPDEGTRAG